LVAGTLRELGRGDEAEATLRNVLTSHPHDFDALTGLAQLARDRGDRSASLALLQQAASTYPAHPGLKSQIAGDLRELGPFAEAEFLLTELLASHPRHIDAMMSLGWLKLESFDLDAAEALFRRATSAAPADPSGPLGLGRVARRRGDGLLALSHFEAARAASPNHPGVAVETAAALRELGRSDEAQKLIESVLDASPGDVRAVMQMAYLQRQKGEYRKALDLFGIARTLRPRQADILVEMAIEHRALGQPAESEKLLHEALAIDPKDPSALDHLASHYSTAEDFEQALAFSLRGIAAHPRRVAPYVRASRAAAELGRRDEAVQLLDQGCEAVGPHPEILGARVTLHMQQQNWTAAAALLSEAGALSKRYSCLWTQQAELALTLGDYAAAEAALPIGAALSVEDASGLQVFRGLIAEARWQLTEATAHYEDALALDPSNSWAHAELARAALKSLDLEGCRAHQRRATQLRATSHLLRGQSLNISQNMIGQLLDEFAFDRPLLEELRRIRALPLDDRQIEELKQVVISNPDHTPSAMMLLTALRQAGRLVMPLTSSPNGTFEHIPHRIIQYWNDTEPPSDIAKQMQSWRDKHPDFEHILFEDAGAQDFLHSNGLTDVLRAYKHARRPAQRADIFRLAYLALNGGFYADADDLCLAHLGSFIPPDATFVGYQERFATLGNNFLTAAPGHPVIRLALEWATEATNRGDSDVLWLSTGPGLLTRAFAQIFGGI
jgi:tetratricopeptide (TPR) repeat protein